MKDGGKGKKTVGQCSSVLSALKNYLVYCTSYKIESTFRNSNILISHKAGGQGYVGLVFKKHSSSETRIVYICSCLPCFPHFTDSYPKSLM